MIFERIREALASAPGIDAAAGSFVTPVRAGRDFTESDVAGRPRVMVVNEAFATR